MPRSRLAANVFAFRKFYGLTQSELAKKSNINVTHIGYIENERISTGLDYITRLATALNTDPCVLLARPFVKFQKTGIKTKTIIPTWFKEGVAAYAFWTNEGMEYHEIAPGSYKNALTMMALIQNNGLKGKDLMDQANKLHVPYKQLYR